MSSAFDPFLAYELIDESQTKRLHAAMKNHRQALDDFLEDDEPDPEKAQQLMRSLETIERTYNDISNSIYRVPATVHIAGEVGEEANPDNPEQMASVQRCSRCGSMLQFWWDGLMYLSPDGGVRDLEEEDARWWDVGQVIAKTDLPGAIDLYPVKNGRELENWETECADLSELEALLETS